MSEPPSKPQQRMGPPDGDVEDPTWGDPLDDPDAHDPGDAPLPVGPGAQPDPCASCMITRITATDAVGAAIGGPGGAVFPPGNRVLNLNDISISGVRRLTLRATPDPADCPCVWGSIVNVASFVILTGHTRIRLRTLRSGMTQLTDLVRIALDEVSPNLIAVNGCALTIDLQALDRALRTPSVADIRMRAMGQIGLRVRCGTQWRRILINLVD